MFSSAAYSEAQFKLSVKEVNGKKSEVQIWND